MAKRALGVALIAGEESGDQLGAGLIDAILRKRPDATFVGIAGERMQARGMRSLFPISDVAVMGLGPVIASLPRLIRRVHQAADHVISSKPDVLVIIDSPDLTHPIARRVAKRLPDLPIVDYVSPSVWAWRPGRAKRMTGYIDHVLALLPFEPEAHRKLGGPPCTYVGHPLIERLDVLRPRPGERPPLAERSTLLVLPGSRRSEISRLMGPFGEALRIIAAARADVEFLLPAVPHLADEVEERIASWKIRPEIVRGEDAKFSAFRGAHAALAASGTVTLELTLAGVPTVVAYRVDRFARLLKPLVTAPSMVLTNLILGENIVPEFLDDAGSPVTLARETLALLSEGPARERQLNALRKLDELMALPGGVLPSDKAAEIVLAAAETGVSRNQRRAEIGT
jgi:lipid-A-disaccharide synthase